MTYKEWERKFKKTLKPLPFSERERATEYYRETFAEKTADGATPEEVLRTFGAPEVCAYRILSESGDYQGETAFNAYTPTPNYHTTRSLADFVGLFFLTVLLILPLAGGAIGVIAGFSAVCISGIATSLAGVIFLIASPFLGVSGVGTVALLGVGITAIGVGALLFVGFYYATKWTAQGVWKALRYIYRR